MKVFANPGVPRWLQAWSDKEQISESLT